ncbi:adaptor protein MecA [Tuanshanicoccus lijuaniae]|uniref:adaptor protein MecA n=1 Tax=Aerococcaceae bacterium zg-1292 TaxID=2774330 RepID=UPI001934D5EA|nr:adaptor protein MecA [Aerococcaceae bacterium zg-1292]MBF6626579.1 adaptor protein MecA [Aerococcaceae bacterium zg-BR9]MBF6978944.1 adaptor protein MecA [Aerococcaceae bacterium zg-BR22]MBS4455378.1 adaptor protein MecA [Aerococcaceae bacterium zg-A91]MBS4457338.1 adaptor protein MecA [Aerococcaceae bacterium zg-BR33]
MEMERINENLIKVIIDVEDLEERGINFLDLISDQTSVEKFFYSILTEVGVEQQFYDSETITFQVIPSNNGIELYISRASFDEMENFWDTEIFKRLRERKAEENGTESMSPRERIEQVRKSIIEQSNEVEKAEEELDEEAFYSYPVVCFETLDDFIQFARLAKDYGLEGDLYEMVGRYYFHIYNMEELVPGSEPYYSVLKMFDYGESHPATLAILEEYGNLIRSVDSIYYFGTNF